MFTTVPYDRLTSSRLPWATLALAALWVGFFLAGSAPALGLAPDVPSTSGWLGHWLLPETGAQLAVSLLLLGLLGPVLEEAWGPAFFVAFVALAALASAAAYVASGPDPTRPLVGGAGVLAALLGGCMARHLKDGISYTIVYWAQQVRHVELWVPAYALPGAWFAAEVVMEVAAAGAGPTRGLNYAGQAAGLALGAAAGFALRHYDLEQSWLGRRPADAPDPAIEKARMLLEGGSADAALRLLQPAVMARPHDPLLVGAYCRAACAANEPQLATDIFVSCLTKHLKSGEGPVAAGLWKDWAEELGHPEIDARLALPLAEALATRGHGPPAARLLRGVLENPRTLSTGMALRIVDLARPIHAGVAIRAATLALEGGDFPEAKRSRLEAIVRELEARRADQSDPELDLGATTSSGPDRSIDIALDEEDLHQPPPELRRVAAEKVEAPEEPPTEWTLPEEPPPLASEPEPEPTPPPAPAPAEPVPDVAERDALFGSSDEMDLASPDMDTHTTTPTLAATPVGTAPRLVRPGERQTTQRELMPLQPDAEPDAEPDPVPAPTPDSTGPALAAAQPRFQDAKCIEVVPVAWQGTRLTLRQGTAKPGALDLAQVQAIATAGVSGLAARPVVLIDLLLNWNEVGEAPLRILRLRSDRFDPGLLPAAAVGGLDGFRAVLDALLEQSGATPLPDAKRGRGRPFARFDRLEAYEREVLGLER